MSIVTKAASVGLVLAVSLANSLPVVADTHQWNVGSEDWHSANNWYPTALPGSSDTAWIHNGGTAHFHTGDVYTVSTVIVEGTGSGQDSHIQQDGGTLTASNVYAGYNLANTGTYQLSAGTLHSTSNSDVGLSTYGTFTHSGGTHQVGANLTVGGNSSGTGTYTMSGSASLTVSGTVTVGYDGSGIFNQSGGTANNGSGTVYIGRHYGSDGAYNLSGGSLTTQTVDISSGGTGVLDWTGGNLYVGTAVRVHSGGTMTVGQDWGFTRAITVDGGELDLGTHALAVRSLDSLAVCTLSAGSLTAGSIDVSITSSGYQGTFTWTGGTLSAGTITVHPGGKLSVGADKTFSGNVYVNGGTIEVASGYTLTVTGTFGETDNDHKTITKTGGGTLVIQGTQRYHAGAMEYNSEETWR